MDAPLLFSLLRNPSRAGELNELFLASRETAELRAETAQMGYSLCRLLRELGVPDVPKDEMSYPAAYALAARAWGIEPRAALEAYLWSWLENQVMAAIKAVPLGQTDGQRILLALGEKVGALAARAQAVPAEELCNFAPGLAVLSSRHETQYSRIFRS